MALFKRIHLSSWHWEDRICLIRKMFRRRAVMFNEVSVDLFFSALIRVVPRYKNLVPLWDWGFFVYKNQCAKEQNLPTTKNPKHP
jgi:hypothetical protein